MNSIEVPEVFLAARLVYAVPGIFEKDREDRIIERGAVERDLFLYK